MFINIFIIYQCNLVGVNIYNLDDFLGNDLIVKNIKNIIKSENTLHSYIICGEKGVGKTLLSNVFAKALQCESESSNNKPCGVCTSCILFDSNNHPDVIFVKPSNKKTKTNTLSVDDIKEQILENIKIKQYGHKYKIFIIDDAQNLSVVCQNVLLKTLEEPVSYAIFLLATSDMNAFLSTIVSRCFIMDLKPLKDNDIVDYVAKNYPEEINNLNSLLSFSNGSLGVLLDFLKNEELKTLKNYVYDTLVNLKNTDIVSAMNLSKNFENYKTNLFFLDLMLIYYRDLLIYKSTLNDNHIINIKLKNIYTSENLSYDSLFKKINAIVNAKDQLSKNANFKLTFEVLLLTLKEN